MLGCCVYISPHTFFGKGFRVMGTKTVRVSIDLVADFHEELKLLAKGKTMKNYVVDAVAVQMQKENELEDAILCELAEEATKEGYISVEESKELSSLIRNA